MFIKVVIEPKVSLITVCRILHASSNWTTVDILVPFLCTIYSVIEENDCGSLYNIASFSFHFSSFCSYSVTDEGVVEDMKPIFNISALQSTVRIEKLNHHSSDTGEV